jgi:hypothetical protein
MRETVKYSKDNFDVMKELTSSGWNCLDIKYLMMGGHMEKKKKKYIKPEIVRVKLVAEEAVLAACKMKNSLGPNEPFHCAHGHDACYSIGS